MRVHMTSLSNRIGNIVKGEDHDGSFQVKKEQPGTAVKLIGKFIVMCRPDCVASSD